MSDNRLKVLHCLGSLDRGGVETWLLRVLHFIDLTKYQLDFCCFGGHPGTLADEAQALGSHVLLCPLNSNLTAFNSRFAGIIHEGGYQVVHSHVHFFSGYVLRQAAALGVRGRVAHSHTTSDAKSPSQARHWYRAWMQRWIQAYANAGAAASSEAAAALFGPLWRDDARWRIIYCGIDVDQIAQRNKRQEVRRTFAVEPNTVLVGQVGKLHSPKNHLFLIEVIRELTEMHPSVKALIVGEGPLRTTIEKAVQQKELQSQVIMLGERQDIPELLSALDVFLMPSLFEGLPVAGLEAQAAGVPVIFSNAVTPEAAVVSDLVTFMPPKASAREWALKALDVSSRRASHSTIALSFEQKGFTIQASRSRLTDLYDSLISTPTSYARQTK